MTTPYTFTHSEGNGRLGKTRMACGYTITVSQEFKDFLIKYFTEKAESDPEYRTYGMDTVNMAVFFSTEHGVGPAQTSMMRWNKPRLPHMCKSGIWVYQWWLKKNRAVKKDGRFNLKMDKLYISKKGDLIIGAFRLEDGYHRYAFFYNEKDKATTFIKQQLDRDHLKELSMEEVSLPEEFAMEGVPYSV